MTRSVIKKNERFTSSDIDEVNSLMTRCSKKMLRRKTKCLAFSLIEIMISITIISIALVTMASMIMPMHSAQTQMIENTRAAEIAQNLIEKFQSAAWHRLGQDPWSWHRREDPDSEVGKSYVDTLGSDPEEDYKHRPLVDQPNLSTNLYGYLENPDGDVDTDDEITMAEFIAKEDGVSNVDRFGLPYTMANQKDEYGSSDSGAEAPAKSISSDVADYYNDPLRYNWLQFLGIIPDRSGLQNLQIFVEYYNQDLLDVVDSLEDWKSHIDDDESKDKIRELYRMVESHDLLNFESLEDMDRNVVVIRILLTWERIEGGVGNHEVMLARRR